MFEATKKTGTLNPFTAAVPFGDKVLGTSVVYPQIGTAGLKGLREEVPNIR